MKQRLLTGIISFFFSFFVLSFALAKLSPPIVTRAQVLSAAKTAEPLSSPSEPDPSPATSPQPSAIPSPEIPTPDDSPVPSTTPKPTVSPVSDAQLNEWFTTYANKESVNKDLLKKIAVCESQLHTMATNGPYGGLFQFSTSTWIATRTAMNLNSDPALRFNSQEAIKTAAFRLATVGFAAWPNCSK